MFCARISKSSGKIEKPVRNRLSFFALPIRDFNYYLCRCKAAEWRLKWNFIMS